jgi:hypothetical protein
MDAIHKQFLKISYLFDKIDLRIQELHLLLSNEKPQKTKKKIICEEKETILIFK